MVDENSILSGNEETPLFVEYARRALDEHVKMEPFFVSGYVSLVCDVDVKVDIHKRTLKKNCVFVFDGDEDINAARLCRARIGGLDEALQDIEEKAEIFTDEETGVTYSAVKADSALSFNIDLEPVDMGNDQTLTVIEFLVWLAITTAESDREREAIFNSAYTVEVNEAERLPQQDTAKPRKRQDPKTKLSRFIGMPDKNAEMYKEIGLGLNVASPSEKKKDIAVEQVVAIKYMGAPGIIAEGREQLTKLDRQVHNSVISHFAAGNRIITLTQVCEFVYGHNKPTAEQRREVEECIDRQMWTKITIDMTDEAAKHTLKNPELLTNFKIEGQMLAIQKVTARAANGKKIIAYQLMGEPILYTHARVTNQILTYPAKLLQAPSGTKNTEKTMAIRQTLMEEIDRAAKGNRKRFIKYDTIYELSGEVPNSRTERNRQNNYVRSFLDRLKENGDITAWTERKDGRKITGFEVSFPDRKKPQTAARGVRK